MGSSPFDGVLTVSSATGQRSEPQPVAETEMCSTSSDHEAGVPGHQPEVGGFALAFRGPEGAESERPARASLARRQVAPASKRPRP